MKLKSLLLTAGLCMGAGASAQVGTGGMQQISLEIKPRLHAVEHAPLQSDRTQRAADISKAAREKGVNVPARVLPALAGTDADGKLKLDSIVTTNPDGSNASLQEFKYNSKGKETARNYYYWDAATGTWGEPVEQYEYVWNEDGLILSQQAKGYGTGRREEFKYNEQGLGIEQITYQTDADGSWVAVSKGEYVYDDNANIIEETLYSWDGSQWQPTTHNYASWDANKRQTSYTGYTWDGTQWVGAEKYDYVWFDGPFDPEAQYQEGIDTVRMTYKGNFFWIDGKWQQYYFFTNDIAEDGRLMGQSEHYFDRKSGTWCGGDDWDARLGIYTTWKSRHTFNDRGNEILVETWKCLPDSAGWVLLGSSPTEWTYDEEGNREGLTKYVNYVYDDEYNKTGESCTQQTWYGYNANNYKTWIVEQTIAADGTIGYLFEEKYGYDNDNNLTYAYVWDWVDGERKQTSRSLYTYDTDGNMTEAVIMNGGGGGLQPLGSPLRSAALDPEDEEGWVNSTRITYEYVNGVLVARRSYKWTNEEWTTNNGQVVEYDFDVPSSDACFPEGWTDPYKINWIEDIYGDGSNGWMATTRNYFYSENTATAIAGATATGETGIGVRLSGDMLTITADGDVSVSIYGVGGTLVKTAAEKTVYVGDMPAGIYIVAVNGYKTKIVKK